VLEAEQVPVDAGSLRLLSRAARGSMRDALSLTDQAIAYGGGQLAEEGVRAMLGSVDRRHAARLVQALAQRDGPAVLQTVDELRGWGLSASGTLEEMAALLQQMAVQQAVPGALDESDPDTADTLRLAALMSADETQLLYSIAIHGRAELSLVSDDYAALTMVLLRLFAFPPAGGAGAAAPAPRSAPLQAAPREARMSTAARSAPLPKPLPAAEPAAARTSSAPAVPLALAGSPTPPARSTTATGPRTPVTAASEPPPWVDESVPDDAITDAPAPTTPARSATNSAIDLRRTPEGERWAALVRPLLGQGGLTALVRELAVQAQLLGVEGQTWRLRVERETLRTNALRDKLLAALEPVLGAGACIELEGGNVEDSIARREAAEREAAQREAEQVIRNDPAVGALMAQFRTARIVPGSIKPL
jgi:DNA polymerase-3 subunit gamma/tau